MRAYYLVAKNKGAGQSARQQSCIVVLFAEYAKQVLSWRGSNNIDLENYRSNSFIVDSRSWSRSVT